MRCTSKHLLSSLSSIYLFVIFSKQIRSTLKEQMEQKIQTDKNETEIHNRATELIMEQDRQDIEQEKRRQAERARALLQFTIKNKEVSKNDTVYIIIYNLIYDIF